MTPTVRRNRIAQGSWNGMCEIDQRWGLNFRSVAWLQLCDVEKVT